ncbi:DNA/RNA helicase domain-containing protein [Actinophytocola oryzae]|uniref:DNA/RNA helicase domain-containing protein n=1 Tax=Actinophytocola oryzae TaxID=502181 RepID=UPI00312C8A88
MVVVRGGPGSGKSAIGASDPDGSGQVGCVYTAQGFEYDWAGVIFGKDLVVRDGRWRPQPNESHDTSVKRVRAKEFLELARNTYKVLMTRGMQGVCLYSEDPETNGFFHRYCR